MKKFILSASLIGALFANNSYSFNDFQKEYIQGFQEYEKNLNKEFKEYKETLNKEFKKYKKK